MYFAEETMDDRYYEIPEEEQIREIQFREEFLFGIDVKHKFFADGNCLAQS